MDRPNTTLFNIRGTRFETSTSNLKAFPGSLLAHLEDTCSSYNRETKEYFFDKDPHVFNCILNMLNHGKLHVPREICVQLLRDELIFWGIPFDTVDECCWRTFFRLDEDKEIMARLRDGNNLDSNYEQIKTELFPTVRQRIWTMCDQPGSSKLAKVKFLKRKTNSFYM